ncbi:hypothetical protein E3E26_04645 [Thermococcus sp. LS1]|uniref:hypothetical protein n=1 Tax=Thermococcus sp. LS1 TaxID=1638259 RepID=UPI001438978A|nr:hypothetical protein [Thermococcus sp. LS1]NJD99076.1 hypothetical protein [Thermococcus sp. LS1]
MGRNKVAISILIFCLLFVFFLPKGLLIPADVKDVDFGEVPSSLHCPPNIHIKTEYYQYKLNHFVNFTLIQNQTPMANITLRGVEGKYLCLPEGILVYAYYPGSSRSWAGTTLALFDYNMSLKWWRPFSAYPLRYTRDGLILVSSALFGSGGESCAYLMNISTGETTFRFCPDVLGAHISDVRIIGDKAYVTVGWPDRGWSSLKTKVILYIVEGKKVKRKTITSINGEGLGIRVRVDADDSHVAVAYYLKNEKGEEKNGVCIYTAGHLIKIACKSFNERPYDVKLDGNIVYIKTWNSVKAYKIIGP